MHTSHATATRRALGKLPLGSLVLVASAGIGLFTGDATAGLSPGQTCAVKKLKASEQGSKLCSNASKHQRSRVGSPRAPASRLPAPASPRPSSNSRPRAAALPPPTISRSGA
jgi:hypothetical protein